MYTATNFFWFYFCSIFQWKKGHVIEAGRKFRPSAFNDSPDNICIRTLFTTWPATIMSQHSLFDCQRTTNNLLHSALLIQHFNIMKSNNPSYDKREGKDQQWLLHKKNTLIHPPFQCVHQHNLHDVHFEPILRATFLQIMATFFFQQIHLLLFDPFKMAKSLQQTLNFVPKRGCRTVWFYLRWQIELKCYATFIFSQTAFPSTWNSKNLRVSHTMTKNAKKKMHTGWSMLN